MIICSNLFKFTLSTIIIYKVGNTRCHFRRHALIQHNFFHFLGRALIWPGCFGEQILGLFGLYSSSLSKSVGFVSLSGKASLVSISAAILFLRSWHVYFPLEFEFRGKSCQSLGLALVTFV